MTMLSDTIFLHPIDHFFYENKETVKPISPQQSKLREENKDNYFEEHKISSSSNSNNSNYEKTENSFSSDVNISDEEFNFEFLNNFAEENPFNYTELPRSNRNLSAFPSSRSLLRETACGSCSSAQMSNLMLSIKSFLNYFNYNDLKNEIKNLKAKSFEKFKSVIHKKISAMGKNGEGLSAAKPALFQRNYGFSSNNSNQNCLSLIENKNQVFMSLSIFNNNNNYKNNENKNNNENINEKKSENVFAFGKNSDINDNCESNGSGKSHENKPVLFSIFSLLNENNSEFFSQIKLKSNGSKTNIFTNEAETSKINNNKNSTNKEKNSIPNTNLLMNAKTNTNYTNDINNNKSSEFAKKPINSENSIFNLMNKDKLLINKNVNLAFKNSLKSKRKNNYFDNCFRKQNHMDSVGAGEAKLKISDLISSEVKISNSVQSNNIYSFYLKNKEKIAENFESYTNKSENIKNNWDSSIKLSGNQAEKIRNDNCGKAASYRSFNFFLAKGDKEFANSNNNINNNRSSHCFVNNSKSEGELKRNNKFDFCGSDNTNNIYNENNYNNKTSKEFFDLEIKLRINSFLINEILPNERTFVYEKNSKIINDSFKF